MRHPIYLAADLLAFGTAVWAATPLVIIMALVLLVGGDVRARLEERVLVQAFGDDYVTYMRKVRRSLPGIY